MWAAFKILAVWIPLGSIAGIVGIPYTLLVRDITRLYWTSMWIVRTGLHAGGIRMDVAGLENLPPGKACILASNHVSNLDPPVLIQAVPARCSVLLKKELISIPILGHAMKLAGFVPVERGSRREAAQASVAAAAKALAQGLHIIVYPEGTRSPDGRLSAFKKGPFYLAQQTNAPVIPIAIWGTREMMQKGSAAVTPGVATLRFLPAIQPSDFASREELMQAVRGAIAGALPEHMKPLAG